MIMENNLGLTQDRCFPFRFLYRLEYYYSLPSFLSIFLVMKLIESKQQQLDKKKLDTSLSPSPQNSYGLDDIRKHIGSTHTSANYAASESGRRMRSDTLTEAAACAWESFIRMGKGMPDQCLSLPPKMKNEKEREEEKLPTLSSTIFPDLRLYEYLVKCRRSQRLSDASQSRVENNTGMKAVAEPRFSWWWGK